MAVSYLSRQQDLDDRIWTSSFRKPAQFSSIRMLNLATLRWAIEASSPVLYQMNGKLLPSINRQESSVADSGMWSRVMPNHGVGSDPMARLQQWRGLGKPNALPTGLHNMPFRVQQAKPQNAGDRTGPRGHEAAKRPFLCVRPRRARAFSIMPAHFSDFVRIPRSALRPSV
jgi:hypothetical protein